MLIARAITSEYNTIFPFEKIYFQTGIKCTLPVSEGGDYKTRCISKVLMGVSELCIANIGEAVFLNLVPPVT